MTQYLQQVLDAMGGPTVAVAIIVAIVALVILLFFRAQLRTSVAWAMAAYGWMYRALMWLFPPILVGVASLFPELHNTSGVQNLASRGGFVVAVMGAIWITMIQIPAANEPNTPLDDLKRDFYVSAMWAGVLLAATVYAFGKTGLLEIWLALPAIIVWIDLYTGTRAAFNNAFQKNPTQIQRT